MLVIDFETRSEADLKKLGPWEYAKHESTRALCLAWLLVGSPIGPCLWLPEDNPPQALFKLIADGHEVHAHNAFFEKCIWQHVMTPRHDWPGVPEFQWRCSAAQAAALALPRSLDGAGEALGLRTRKDKAGHKVMLKLCKPRKPTKNNPSRWHNDPKDFQTLYDYCVTDVVAEAELAQAIPELIHDEQALWFLDQRINARGIPIDTETVRSAIRIAGALKVHDNERVSELTGYAVTAATQVDCLKNWLSTELGRPVANVTKETVEKLLSDDQVSNSLAGDVLRIRQGQGKTSTAKYTPMLGGSGDGGRLRDTMMFNGASTGRWSGRKFQPHNLPRAGVADDCIDLLISAIQSEDANRLRVLFGEPMAALSKAVRNCVCAKPGHKLICADFSAIEARVLAWLAGEEWKIQGFRDFDAGKGEDFYVASALRVGQVFPSILNTGLDVRQLGKVLELAFGYGGGAGAVAVACESYGIDLTAGATAETVELAQKWAFGKWGSFIRIMFGPSAVKTYKDWDDSRRRLLIKNCFEGRTRDKALRVCMGELVKDAWRQSHPAITNFWYDLEDAAVEAIRSESGSEHWAGPVMFQVEGRFLFCRLPSGRRIAYNEPRIVTTITPWGKKKPTIRFMGVEPPGRKRKGVAPGQWADQSTYGGSLAENVTQAAARCFLSDAMKAVESEGYLIVFHVHDEIVCEVPEDFGSIDELCRLMSVSPMWGDGCPIAATGFEGQRYHK